MRYRSLGTDNANTKNMIVIPTTAAMVMINIMIHELFPGGCCALQFCSIIKIVRVYEFLSVFNWVHLG